MKTKLVEVEDAERIYARYIQIDDKLINRLANTSDLDDWRDALFDATVQGYDISFAMTYDWVVEYIVDKILKGRKKKEKPVEFEPETKAEPKDFKMPKKVKWGKYERTPTIKYQPKETLLLKNMIVLGYNKARSFEIFARTYDKRTKQAVYRKILRMQKE